MTEFSDWYPSDNNFLGENGSYAFSTTDNANDIDGKIYHLFIIFVKSISLDVILYYKHSPSHLLPSSMDVFTYFQS